jgi:sterol desaturase/sphingolipid hydroxylase (fatty acid hydroxylase superfamily)
VKRIVQGLFVVGAVFGAVFLLERRRPLRQRVDRRVAVRASRNAVLGGSALIVSAGVEWLVVRHVGRWAQRHRVGLLRAAPLSPAFARLVGFLLLDYSIYVWHLLNHRVPWLWRFHLVHHADRDLDASTGLRFHFGELALTSLLRAVQVVVIGADPRTIQLWQRLLTASVLFHHGNLRLPLAAERVMARVLVTPRMHGIHHSEVRQEADSNYASLLSVWDRLHGTLRLNVAQDAIVIGVPGLDRPEQLTLGRMLLLPFAPPPSEPASGAPERGLPGTTAWTLAP